MEPHLSEMLLALPIKRTSTSEQQLAAVATAIEDVVRAARHAALDEALEEINRAWSHAPTTDEAKRLNAIGDAILRRQQDGAAVRTPAEGHPSP